MLRVERNDGLLPCLRTSHSGLGPPRLAFSVLCVDADDLDVEKLFDGFANIIFAGHPVDFKRIGVETLGLVITLFGHQEPKDDLVRFELQFCFGYVVGHGPFVLCGSMPPQDACFAVALRRNASNAAL